MPRLDLGDGLVDAERVAGDVPGVCDLLGTERGHGELCVPGAQQPRAGPHGGRPEPGAGPVGRARVEREPGDHHVALRHFIQAR